MTAEIIAIVGAGHAGCQLATSLRELGSHERIILIGDEPRVPYRRPPLSKEYLLGRWDEASLALRAEKFFASQKIELVHEQISHVTPESKSLLCASGAVLQYDKLVLATGARNRTLTVPGADRSNVYSLRTLDDARRLRGALQHAGKVAVVGAGLIGTKFAAGPHRYGPGYTRSTSSVSNWRLTCPRRLAGF
jgi:NADPH-dependent 2,4-dienoyl-CoA reductase/sulfur reductase-like enzyme